MSDQNNGVYFRGLLIDNMVNEQIIDVSQTAYFYNQVGDPHFIALSQQMPPIVKFNPDIAADLTGFTEVAVAVISTDVSEWGVTQELAFNHDHVKYQPVRVTPEYAAAFGMVLVNPEEAVLIESNSQQLSYCQYEYGRYAGYSNPYLDPARGQVGRTMYPFICTDLEGHNFPHVFMSDDPDVDLVISVGVLHVTEQTLIVGDLWIPRGGAVYIPPQDIQADTTKIYLHNNRNSANACFGKTPMPEQIQTHSLLNPNGKIHWFWNRQATEHPQL